MERHGNDEVYGNLVKLYVARNSKWAARHMAVQRSLLQVVVAFTLQKEKLSA